MFSAEFENNKILQACLAVLVFVYFLVFSSWISRGALTIDLVARGGHQCVSYFQNCETLYFLQALPEGYSQTFFYMVLFGFLTTAAYFLMQRDWKEAQQWLLIPFLWHFVSVFFLTNYFSGNYEYYIAIFATVILFLPHKEFFAKLAIVSFYTLSTVAKLHPAWVTGGYFTSLQLGLPLFPVWSIPILTNVVILAEMVGAWFLFSRQPIVQRSALLFFVAFHFYSGILVEYRYPATVLPMLLVLFGPWYRHTPVPLTKKSISGWLLIALLFTLQLSPKAIPGDEKLTLEGNKFGLYMFESNHQCISQATIEENDGTTESLIRATAQARHRCDPYDYWFFLQQICAQDQVSRVTWTFDHSINGDPFLRIVDVENACALEYKPFSHNAWIKTHADNPEVIGSPAKNFYY